MRSRLPVPGVLLSLALASLAAPLGEASAQVSLAWSHRISHVGGNAPDEGRKVARDAQGCVYLAAFSKGATTDIDFAIVKYSPTGERVWATRFPAMTPFPGSGLTGNDTLLDMALSPSGDRLYATGWTGSTNPNNDVLTVCFDTTTGSVNWSDSLDMGGDEEGAALAVTPSGDVVVTGRAANVSVGIYWNIVTAAYDQYGTRRWIAMYDGPGHYEDEGRSIAADSFGNVFVGGYHHDAALNKNYVAIKYDQNGVQYWVAEYDGPAAGSEYARKVKTDQFGNVYLTGYSTGVGTGTDYATVKLDPNGFTLWAARYNGPGNGTDEANDLIIDGAGDVYVTGWSRGLTPLGDYGTVKYSGATGQQLWAARYEGPGGNIDFANALGLDAFGGLYVTGSSRGTGLYTDIATVKYDAANGTHLGVARWNGPGDRSDEGQAILVDPSGLVFIAGVTGSVADGDDACVLALNLTGQPIWTGIYRFSSSVDLAMGMALDASRNPVVVTNVESAGGGGDILIRKLSPAGAVLWSSVYDSSSHRGESAQIGGLSIDPAGNVYVLGVAEPVSGPIDHIETLILKYNSAGQLQWAHRIGQGPGTQIYPQKIGVDASGRVFVMSTAFNQTLIAGISTTGSLLWSYQHAGPGPQGASYPYGLLVHPTLGALVSFGEPIGSLQFPIYQTRIMRFDPITGPGASAVFSNPGGNFFFWQSTMDSSNRPYFAGVVGVGAVSSVRISRLSFSTLAEEWTTTYAPAEAIGSPLIITDPLGGVIVNTYLTATGQGRMLRYVPPSTTPVWVYTAATQFDPVGAGAADAQGNLYGGGRDPQGNLRAWAFNSAGQFLWQRAFVPPPLPPLPPIPGNPPPPPPPPAPPPPPHGGGFAVAPASSGSGTDVYLFSMWTGQSRDSGDLDSVVLKFRPGCAGDINNDGQRTSQDIFDFLNYYFAGNMIADINGSGTLTSQDIFDFLAAFFAPCV